MRKLRSTEKSKPISPGPRKMPVPASPNV
jgi:hypothetical protein